MKKYLNVLCAIMIMSFSGCTYNSPDEDKYILKNTIEQSIRTYDAIIIPIDNLYINTCSKAMLMSIDGIGKKKADKIIKARRISPIRSMEDVEKIKGLGTKTILEIEKRVVFDGFSSEPESTTDTNDS